MEHVKEGIAAITTDESDVVEEPMALIADNDAEMYNDNDGKYYNFDHVPSSTEMDICLIYYDWLADLGATTHITHQRKAFTTYQKIPKVPVAGVGRIKAHMVGKGTIRLISECKGHIYVLELQDILYVPNNRNNLLSLGKWETAS